MVVSTLDSQADAASGHRIELAPNCSLTPRSARVCVGGLAVVTYAVAAICGMRGLWLVLPFAGLEIGLLWRAVRASMNLGRRCELALITDDSVLIERHGLTIPGRTVFARHWATVKLRGPPAAQHPSRLAIESHGRACEVGRFLTEEEHLGLAGRLRQLVGKSSESPALEARS